AAGGGTRETHRVHGAFRSAVAEANHFYRKAFADLFREFPLHVVGHAEHCAGAEFLLDGCHHSGMAVPRHQRAEAKIEVDILVSIDIVNVAAFSVAYKYRIGIV